MNPPPPNPDFGLFYEQNVERIYRFLLARTGSVAEAEDLTSETFHAALEGYTRCRPGEGPSWLAGIAHHKLIDSFRRRKKVEPLEWAVNLPMGGPNVEDQVGLRLDMARVASALRALPVERAEALALHYFAGLGMTEVGRALGRSEEAAKKLVQRGLAELKQRIDYEKR
ncbi:MAG: RNA polymerase sigma factor [Anaerolineaceae bacterium]|nr:RNA polymerase sigma factor [Anaerolineaceae bacterium]